MNQKDIATIRKDAADKDTAGGLGEAIARWLGFGGAVAKAGGKVPAWLVPMVDEWLPKVQTKISRPKKKK